MQTIKYKMDVKNKVLLYSAGNYIQHPIINQMEKNMKKDIYNTYITYIPIPYRQSLFHVNHQESLSIYLYITKSLGSVPETNTTL